MLTRAMSVFGQKPVTAARQTTMSSFGFTRAYKKIVLTKDVDNLGFIGETCFVKPGHALNNLVPTHQALFFSDPKA